ncbi:MAG: HPr(Ser) kinase/phosphatase [Burkholderiales bacterium]
MPRVSVAQLFEDNRERLSLTWGAGKEGAGSELSGDLLKASTKGLIGHLNFIHPNWIQVLGGTETDYLARLDPVLARQSLQELAASGPVCLLVSDGRPAPADVCAMADAHRIPVLLTPISSIQLMWMLRPYLARSLSEFVTRHGVFLDVLGMGVLITGDSGVGKSELALELISRGSGLVADDVVELYRIGPDVLEGRCPPLLRDFLEVRGLGMLNIRTIFGETAVRVRKNLKLIVQLEKPVAGIIPGLERLPLNASSEIILANEIRKVQLPVAAGRNLAVLVEAAVRNTVLQLRGYDSTREFIRRHEEHLNGNK